MSVTLKDVANEAGVSISTVSRVIRNAGYIDKQTRVTVLEAIKKLQYRPHTVARLLRYGRTNTIGYVLNDISNPFFGYTVKGAEQYLRKMDGDEFELVLANTNAEPHHELKALETMINKHVEGIIISSTATRECIEMIHQIVKEQNIPVVSIDNSLDGAEYAVVTTQNRAGAYQLMSHLIEHGHERIGIIAGPEAESHARERVEGCRQALEDNGLKVGSGLLAHGNWSHEDGFKITMGFLQSDHPPTAIFCSNNFMCMGALSALRECNLHVPSDIALVSFDDIEFGHLLRPCLTTLDYSWERIGEEAVRLILGAIRSNEPALESCVEVPASILIRESCGCALSPNTARKSDR